MNTKRIFSAGYLKNLSCQAYAQLPIELQEQVDRDLRLLEAEEQLAQAQKMLAPEQPSHVNGVGKNGHQH